MTRAATAARDQWRPSCRVADKSITLSPSPRSRSFFCWAPSRAVFGGLRKPTGYCGSPSQLCSCAMCLGCPPPPPRTSHTPFCSGRLEACYPPTPTSSVLDCACAQGTVDVRVCTVAALCVGAYITSAPYFRTVNRSPSHSPLRSRFWSSQVRVLVRPIL